MSYSQADQWITAYLEGSITDKDFAQLMQWLNASPDHADHFMSQMILLQHMRNHFESRENTDPERLIDAMAQLEDSGSQPTIVDATELMRRREIEKKSKDRARRESLLRMGGMTQSTETGSQTRHYVIPRPLFYGSVAAVIAIATVIFWPTITGQNKPNPGTDKPPTIATLANSVDAVWANSQKLQAYTKLPQGGYDLTKGLVKIIYDNGTELIVEGPARFDLVSEKRVRMHHGKVVGVCPTPSSKGFTVVTPNAHVKDLGTEFGVAVEATGESMIQVYDGEVELIGTKDDVASVSRQLTSGMARRVDKDGKSFAEIPMNEMAFVREAEYQANIQAKNGSDYHQWLAQSFRLRRDTDTVLYYAFDDEQSTPDRLINRASSTFGQLDGDILGGTWAEGRLDGKRALHFMENDAQFNGFGSHIEVMGSREGPLEFGKKSFSIGIWFELSYIRFDDLFAPLITKGDDSWRLHIENKPRVIDWDINDLGKVSNRLVADGTMPSRRWQFVMVVVEFNESSGKAEHRIYVEGVAAGRYVPSQTIHSNQDPVLIGANADVPTRRFIGAIDELVIFDRALTGSEIEALHQLRFGVK